MDIALQLGYLGPAGTHSHQAALGLVHYLHQFEGLREDEIKLVAFPTLRGLMAGAEQQEVSFALLPIENVLEGSVIEVMETLSLQQRKITPHCEFLFPVVHCLIRKEPEPKPSETIKTVLSHPQALSQCRETLLEKYGQTIHFESTSSTAEAVRRLADMSAQEAASIAVIGTASAAKIYGLPVIQENIADMPDNVTRFLLVSAEQISLDLPAKLPEWSKLPQKTSICFGVVDQPGALLDILNIFRSRNVNLSKIESRPSKKKFGEYLFYVDVTGNLTRPGYRDVIQALEKQSTYLQLIGPYTCLGNLTELH